ncbi:MAG: hypothetical protein MZW92_74885 [Comamonadaceae bacterium]|nr:hypothetical protein [Comamonadaceae bacterium]
MTLVFAMIYKTDAACADRAGATSGSARRSPRRCSSLGKALIGLYIGQQRRHLGCSARRPR